MRRLEGTSILAAITIGAALLTAEPANAAVAPGHRDMTFGVHGLAQFPKIPGLPPGDAEESLYVSTVTLTPGKIWVAGEQAGHGYATRLTSAGRTDLSFGATELFTGGDTVFARVAFALPRPNGGAFVISQNTRTVDADPAYFVQALDSRGRIQHSWGYRGFTWGSPLRCRHSVSCGAFLVGGQVLADGRLRLVGSFDDIDDSKADPRTPIVVGLTSAGKRDTSLGPEGWTRVAGSEVAGPWATGAAAFDGHGRIYFLGDRIQGPSCDAACAAHPGIVRTTLDGVLDTSYGTGGVSTLPLPNGARESWAVSLAVSHSGASFAALAVKLASGRRQARLVSARSNGALNTSFGSNGSAAYGPQVGNAYIGQIVATGAGGLILHLQYSRPHGRRYLLLEVSAASGRPTPGFGSHGAVGLPGPVSAILRQSTHRLLVLLPWQRSGIELRRYAI